MTFIDCTPLCENFTRTVQKAMQMRSVWETEAAGFICRMVLSMLLMEPAVKKLVKAFASLNREWCILLKYLPGRRHVWKNVNGIIMAVTTVASHESWSSTGDFYNHCLLHIHGNILHCEETVVFFLKLAKQILPLSPMCVCGGKFKWTTAIKMLILTQCYQSILCLFISTNVH